MFSIFQHNSYSAQIGYRLQRELLGFELLGIWSLRKDLSFARLASYTRVERLLRAPDWSKLVVRWWSGRFQGIRSKTRLVSSDSFKDDFQFRQGGGWGSRVQTFFSANRTHNLYGIFDHSKHFIFSWFWREKKVNFQESPKSMKDEGGGSAVKGKSLKKY